MSYILFSRSLNRYYLIIKHENYSPTETSTEAPFHQRTPAKTSHAPDQSDLSFQSHPDSQRFAPDTSTNKNVHQQMTRKSAPLRCALA